MQRGRLLFVCLVAACSSGTSASVDAAPPVDECEAKPVIAGGAAELGLGPDFTMVTEGQDLALQWGTQTLLMFVVNARAHEMNIVPGQSQGVVNVTALGPDGAQVSLETGCRVRDFMSLPSGDVQLASPFQLPMQPARTPQIDGAKIKIRLEIRDQDGRQAINEVSVVAHLPDAIR